MRALLALPLALGLALAATFAAPVSATEPNAPRSPGAYVTNQSANAEACARACAEDGLCMAWTYSNAGACGLMAVAPTATDTGSIFGVSARAPAFVRRQAPAPIVVPPPIEQTATSAPAPARAGPPAEDETSLALLGGPEAEALRPRLGRP